MKVLFRGKTDSGEWVYGDLLQPDVYDNVYSIYNFTRTGQECFDVVPNTIGQYSGLLDKNDKKIFDGDLVSYCTYDEFECTAVVRFGCYQQDGSNGEYESVPCLGWYVEVTEYIRPKWAVCRNYHLPARRKQQNLLEVVEKCEVVGNIWDNELEYGERKNQNKF